MADKTVYHSPGAYRYGIIARLAVSRRHRGVHSGRNKFPASPLSLENPADDTLSIGLSKNSARQYRTRENGGSRTKRETYLGKNVHRGREGPVCNIFHGWMETTMVSLWRVLPFPRTRQMKFHSGEHHPGQRHIREKDASLWGHRERCLCSGLRSSSRLAFNLFLCQTSLA